MKTINVILFVLIISPFIAPSVFVYHQSRKNVIDITKRSNEFPAELKINSGSRVILKNSIEKTINVFCKEKENGNDINSEGMVIFKAEILPSSSATHFFENKGTHNCFCEVNEEKMIIGKVTVR